MAIPHWKKAPEWAKYVALDANGNWNWFETEPLSDEKTLKWMNIEGRTERAITEKNLCPYWEVKLYRR